MKLGDRRALVCDCEKTIPLDGGALGRALGGEPVRPVSQLCRGQMKALEEALASGEPALVACTQEAPLFKEIAAEAGCPDRIRFANIRETAGWSREAGAATAKIAALLAEAALDFPPPGKVAMRSDGLVLVYGAGERALEAARRLSRRMNVTCLLKPGTAILPPPVMEFPLFQGIIRIAKGHLGAFDLSVDGLAAYRPSSRGAFEFEPAADSQVSSCDVILDLSGDPPLFPRPQARDGYLRVEPTDAIRLNEALFDVLDLVGEFEKPRYLRVDPAICAHSRSGIVGCQLCLDVCPTGAIAPGGDHVSVDARVCAGHGACASVCPTGSIVFDVPAQGGLFRRLQVVSATYHQAGGRNLALLVHDPRYGEELIQLIARAGPGLPAHVVPFSLSEVTLVGIDFLLSALAYGAAQVRILVPPDRRDDLDPLEGHIALIEALRGALGYKGCAVCLDQVTDPIGWAEALFREAPPPPIRTPAVYRPAPEKRTMLALALGHLRTQAPEPAGTIALPPGAPFGQVVLDSRLCTLCLACVGACPTGALGSPGDKPLLNFEEAACVQCGLCRNTCPERAITLSPRLFLTEEARRRVVLKEEELFCCIRCGKPFAVPSTIERLAARMQGHSLFATPERLDLIRMCEDCRIVAQFDDPATPMRTSPRPLPRTTEDYLRERADAEAAARAAGQEPGRTKT